MSSQQTDGGYNAAQLRHMDEETARNTLTVNQYERWESLQELHERADEQREEWANAAKDAVDTMVFADATDLANDATVFGNDLRVYYANDDPRMRETVEELVEIFDIDPEADTHDSISDEDVADEDIDAAKDVLADLVTTAVVEWNGTRWDELAPDAREAIRAQIAADPPDGWGLAGLMDAWAEIEVAVESERDERMERVQKFRQPERRGNR